MAKIVNKMGLRKKALVQLPSLMIKKDWSSKCMKPLFLAVQQKMIAVNRVELLRGRKGERWK